MPGRGSCEICDAHIRATVTPTLIAKVRPDVELVANLVTLGFSKPHAEKAAVAAGNVNLEAALDWCCASDH